MIPKLLLLAALFAACTPLERGADSRPAVRYPTLLIVNRGIDILVVSDESGFTLTRVYPGARACVTLKRNATQQLFFAQAAALEAGPFFNPFSRPGWKVEIGNTLTYDVNRLEPAERCK